MQVSFLRVDDNARTVFWIDQTLLRSIQGNSGLEEKVTELFKLLRDPVYRYLVGVLGNRAEAEELTQEAFLAVYSLLRSGKAPGNCRAWIFRVAHNLAINLQKRRNFTEPLDPLLWTRICEQSSDPGPNAEQRMLLQERYRRLHLALIQLSPQERHCLELRAEGLRFREIAEVLSVRVSTVETFIDRGIKKIMKEIHG